MNKYPSFRLLKLQIVKSIFFLFIFFAILQSSFTQANSEMVFLSSDPNIELAGTLTIPETLEISAAVLLLPVAGPTDKDLSLGNHKYYKVLAEGLAANGIASFRYDDRGVGQSQGEFLQASLEDRVQDACKAMKFLKKELNDVEDYGYIGMSEGAGVSILSSDRCESAAFMVLLSLPVRQGDVEMKSQMKRLLASSFFTDEQKLEIEKEAMKFLDLASSEDSESKRKNILEIMEGKYGSVILPPYQFVPKDPVEKTDFVLSPWYQSQLNYNIQEALSRSSIPTLSIYGNLDQAIDPIANAKQVKEISPQSEVRQMEGINHLMQEANLGSPMEYALLPTSFSKDIVQLISKWILKM
ncbi:MAG: alpha/beta hydrolase [Saprospiraceae bacterium]|nr:alpha/beta hydrolase [Saprospiraceae bacterium]